MSKTGRWAGWLAAIVGLWVLVTAFIWGSGGPGNPTTLFWSNVAAGLVIAILASYAGAQASSSGGSSGILTG